MEEITGNLFDYIGKVDAICITTNGFVKKNQEAVMGRGCAKEAATRYPKIARILGEQIKMRGNIPNLLLQDNSTWIISFPVKPINDLFNGFNAVAHMINKFQIGDRVPGWACLASPEIIERSAILLRNSADLNGWQRIVLPRPGCGAGELNWADIKPILDNYLDNRFYSINFS